ALLVLLVAAAGVAVLSEWLASAVEPAPEALGVTAVFVGGIGGGGSGNAAQPRPAGAMGWEGRVEPAGGVARCSGAPGGPCAARVAARRWGWPGSAGWTWRCRSLWAAASRWPCSWRRSWSSPAW